MDARPDLESIFSAFGVPGIVSVVNEAPVSTTVIWVSSPTDDMPGADYGRRGSEFARRESAKVLAVSRVDVPGLPTGSRIVAPELLGGEDRTWRVDGFERVEPDLTRVIVVDVTED